MTNFELNFLGVNTANFDEMLRFYSEVVRLGIKHSKPGWTAFKTAGMKFELFSTDKTTSPAATSQPTQAPTFIGFETQDIQQALDYMKSQNVPIIGDLATHSWGIDFYINDPDGNVIQIAQYT